MLSFFVVNLFCNCLLASTLHICSVLDSKTACFGLSNGPFGKLKRPVFNLSFSMLVNQRVSIKLMNGKYRKTLRSYICHSSDY